MKGRRLAPWLLVLCLVSCGADGGTSGTGITGGTSGTGVSSGTVDTIIEGNVSNAQQARRETPGQAVVLLARVGRWFLPVTDAVAQGGVDGLRVAVEGSSAEGWTDADGFFSFGGHFAEELTVLFERDDRRARLAATVPSGGTLTLQNVTVDFDSGEAQVGRQGIRFEAIVREKDCLEETIRVTSRFAPDGPVYTVYTDDTRIERTNGRPVSCQQLQPGDEVEIEGSISQDGTIGGDGSRTGQNVTGFDLP